MKSYKVRIYQDICMCVFVCVQVPCGDMWLEEDAAGAEAEAEEKQEEKTTKQVLGILTNHLSSVAIEAFNLIFVQVSFSVVLHPSPSHLSIPFGGPSTRLFHFRTKLEPLPVQLLSTPAVSGHGFPFFSTRISVSGLLFLFLVLLMRRVL